MMFIELHRHSDGTPMLINLRDVSLIRPHNETGQALISWRSTDELELTVRERYDDVVRILKQDALL